MNACELTASITAIANSLACNLSGEELELLSAVFSQLGDTQATIAAQRNLCQKNAMGIHEYPPSLNKSKPAVERVV